jgi:hypothetical protein
MKYLLQITAAAIFLIIGWLISDDNLRAEFLGNGAALIITLLVVEIGYDIYSNRRRLNLIFQCWKFSMKNEYIRFSMSYQYIIKVNDKFLLVKNNNNGFYQHVGGKYKRLPISEKILKDFEGIDDLKLPTHGLTKHDMAVFIPAKNAIKFLDWFNTSKDREISHWREFYEELIDGKGRVLNQKNFPYVNYTFKKSLITPLKKAEAPGWNCWEILQYDILELLPTNIQEQELQELLMKGETDYLKWADWELIQNLGRNNHDRKLIYPIGKHTKWVLNMKWSKE